MTDYSLHVATPNAPLTENEDTNPVTVGTEFVVDTRCWLKEIRWLRPINAPNAHIRVGALYLMTGANTGTMVAGPFDLPVPALGTWGGFALPKPLELPSGNRYRVAVFHPAGRYRAQARWFDATGTGPNAVSQKVGPITVPNNATTRQGSYTYANALTLPVTNGYQGASYFADAIITDVDPNPAPLEPSGAEVKVRTEDGWDTFRVKAKYLTEDGWAPSQLKYRGDSQWNA